MKAKWFGPHLAHHGKIYDSMCVLGMAEELKADGIAVNGYGLEPLLRLLQ